ncbi:MAG: fused MFS/spermidine synthase [Nanoarchaeota archaeon]|nr:fused MFS/spermidine synthase [Nanoarchaeota archaeon]
MKINLKTLLLTGFFLSGMAALIYEVVWTRPLSLIFGSTIYAVSTMLSAFMAGLALGSYILSKYADKLKNPLYTFAIFEICIGIYGLLIIGLFNILPYPFLWIWNKFNPSFAIFNFIQFILCFLVLLIPTTLMGATWPVVNKAYIKHIEKVGKGTGTLYSVNSFGAIIGSWMAGFILIPSLGIRASSIFAAILNLIVGIIIFAISRSKVERPDSEVK